MPETTSAPEQTEYEARAEASSANPADWGRAVRVVLQDLVDRADRDGREPAAALLRDAEVRLRIEPTDDGVSITGTWRPEDVEVD